MMEMKTYIWGDKVGAGDRNKVFGWNSEEKIAGNVGRRLGRPVHFQCSST